MRLTRIFGFGVLALSTVGQVAGSATKYAGTGVEYASWGAKKVFETTENIGYFAKEAGKFTQEQAQELNDYAKDVLRKEEYRNLEDFDFQSKEVENGWIIIDK